MKTRAFLFSGEILLQIRADLSLQMFLFYHLLRSACHSREGGNPIQIHSRTVIITTCIITSISYIGITSNLAKRVWEHKNNVFEGFTKKYKVHFLVYFEQFDDVKQAILENKADQHKKSRMERFVPERLLTGMT